MQHTWAEIEHETGYKSEVEIPRDIRRNFSRLAGLLEIGDKEFIEIRDKLEAYKYDITLKFDNNNIPENEILLDAISLKAYIENNSNIQNINKTISDIDGSIVSKKESTEMNNAVLGKMKWLGLTTILDLDNMVDKYKDLALKFAKVYLKDSKSTKNIGNHIGIFYLCYAKLVSENYTEREMKAYFADNHISGRANENYKKLMDTYTKIIEKKKN